jgi:hypothetical protein
MLVVADIAAGPVFLLAGVFVGALVLLGIGVLEGVVLWRLSWGTFWRSLRDSILANIASGIVGVVISVLGGNRWEQCGYDPRAGGRWCEVLVTPWVLVVGAWLLSVLIEGGVLMLLSKHPPRQIWIAALLINVASYVLLGVFAFLVS